MENLATEATEGTEMDTERKISECACCGICVVGMRSASFSISVSPSVASVVSVASIFSKVSLL